MAGLLQPLDAARAVGEHALELGLPKRAVDAPDGPIITELDSHAHEQVHVGPRREEGFADDRVRVLDALDRALLDLALEDLERV